MSIKKYFKNIYPIYSIDLSDQLQSISGTKSSIIFNIDFTKDISPQSGIDEGTICYIVIVLEALFSYNPSKNIITQEF
jgi:hypothetical protein